MGTNYTTEERRAATKDALYQFASGNMSIVDAQSYALDHGFKIDFREAISNGTIGTCFEALDTVSGELIELEI